MIIIRMKINNIIFFLLITILLVHGIDNHKNKKDNDNDIKESYYDRVLPTTVNHVTNFYNNIFHNNEQNNIQQQQQQQQQHQTQIQTGHIEDNIFKNKLKNGKSDRKLQSGRSEVTPTRDPSAKPSAVPTPNPTTMNPSSRPTDRPSARPSSIPSARPTTQPIPKPSFSPTPEPSPLPTVYPSSRPSSRPTSRPSSIPTSHPTNQPTSIPSLKPSGQPSRQPSGQPSLQPSSQPSSQPTSQPTIVPTDRPTSTPSSPPSSRPTSIPTLQPTSIPTSQPTLSVGYDDDKWFLRNTSPEGFWTSVSSDKKGKVVAATQAGPEITDGSIYVSTNYGKSWGKSSAPMNLWSTVSVSDTGKYMIAAAGKFKDLVFFESHVSTKNSVYFSSDYGGNWSQILPSGYYGDIKMVDSGKICVLAYDSHTSTASKVLLSGDYGSTWNQIQDSVFKQNRTISVNGNDFVSGPPFLHKIVGSRSGQYIVIIESSNYGRIFKSNDTGVSWTVVDNMIGPWSSLAVDYTGRYLIAGQGYTEVIYDKENTYTPGGYLYRSSDFGVSWKMVSFEKGIFSDIVSDSTGRFLSLVYESEPDFYSIYVSSDYGDTWTSSPDVPISKDYSIASTAYGRFLYACSKQRASSVPSNLVKGRISMYRGMAEPEVPLY